jgi:acid phosphatase (class A)
VEKPAGYGYPGGYAALVFVRAGVLAELFPEKRTELLAQAHQRAWARVIGGVHFPSDLVAGRLLGEAVVSALLENSVFLAALEKARAEVKALNGK